MNQKRNKSISKKKNLIAIRTQQHNKILREVEIRRIYNFQKGSYRKNYQKRRKSMYNYEKNNKQSKINCLMNKSKVPISILDMKSQYSILISKRNFMIIQFIYFDKYIELQFQNGKIVSIILSHWLINCHTTYHKLKIEVEKQKTRSYRNSIIQYQQSKNLKMIQKEKMLSQQKRVSIIIQNKINCKRQLIKQTLKIINQENKSINQIGNKFLIKKRFSSQIDQFFK
ncbi:unnamed protein product [Paramecium sonneborni]|uniref:Uncharacterized protein n=1 Tax=Paramecium sonneborni TaxID=65129 RepID=A0A8S1RAK1_9CILI|nr:unnamed protein product [Paramecium sonneborni]CAD8123725.1 unnamed protein product [Paramecium sonneborni]